MSSIEKNSRPQFAALTDCQFRFVKACALLGCVAVAFNACKKEEEVQYPPTPPQNYTQPTATATTTATAAPDAAAPAPTGPTPLDAATQQLLISDIKESAKKDARYMKETGSFFGGTVTQGGQVEQSVMIDPGKCYTVVGSSGPGVVELDIQIQINPMPNVPFGTVIAVDNTAGPKASINPCWKNPLGFGFPAKVVVKSSNGAGAIGAQVYVK